ncbi:MAG: ribbon-helix-helix domain-containing protein [Caldilineaceae bacterium]
MKRTTIMIDENLLYELQQIAEQQQKSTASVLREALALYVTEQQRIAPPVNPLLNLIGLGASAEVTDIANGQDEEILRQEIHEVYGWGGVNGGAR